MKFTRKIALAALASFALASLAAATLSNWYLWHLASRVPDPGRGLVHPRLIGTGEDFGQQFTVYLSSAESVLTFEELYFATAVTAVLSLMPLLWWKFPKKGSTRGSG
jgi:hypothetical protein